MTELSSKFDFKSVEGKWVDYWIKNNLFHATPNPKKKPYTIVIPPPNVTGILHMGHALNNTLQDIIIRYKRMKGFETCWMPGTDHAGIATQNVVEKKLAKEKKSRHDLGREKFLEEVWNWKEHHGSTIIKQLQALGASCDWERTRFTMDPEYSDAVKHVFIELYKKGLIYQGERIINWCPRCQTALSDEEAEHKEIQGTLTHIKYSLKDDPKKFVTVATTRPETMLGDTAVAVNPNDNRYKKLIGKTLILPLMNREIPIIADEFVDPTFGSGAVKVTPAHDPNDYGMGRRHKLPFINVMHPDGKINEKGGAFNGLDRFVARKEIVKALTEAGLIEKIDPHTHAVGHCYRCDTVVEPYLSKQWFVKMAPLAKPAIKAVVDGKIRISPERWNKVYMNWMENIQDWCISRQIWWGHQIPVWYDKNGDIIVAYSQEEAQNIAWKKHGNNDASIVQDPDVLDTWFSSWLWPFATFGWPKQTADVKYFYPGQTLMTASEIIFFWVARMIMAGYEFMGDLPFSDVYIHGTVRDAKGRKMSKSLGNAIDPVEIINEYGADALRFSLIINSGQDLFISKEKFEIGRNFANKIWNASRLILMNIQDATIEADLTKIAADKNLDLPSRWIISRFNSTLSQVEKAIESFRYSEAESLIYDFFWSDLCDWYLEISKDRFKEPAVGQIAVTILKNSLKMMHPFIPFVTEEIWAHIKKADQSAMCVQPWPTVNPKLIDAASEETMSTIINVVSSIRNLRAEWNIKLGDKIDCLLITTDSPVQKLLSDNITMIERLAKTQNTQIVSELKNTKNTASAVVGTIKIAVPLGDLIDIQKEKQRINKQIDEQKKQVQSISGRLNNAGFVEKAPADVIAKDKEKLEGLNQTIKRLEQISADLN